jgi:hypothetical protein
MPSQVGQITVTPPFSPRGPRQASRGPVRGRSTLLSPYTANASAIARQTSAPARLIVNTV